MLMVDSGNESADRLDSLFSDKQPNHSDSETESDVYSKVNEFEVVFEDPKDKDHQKKSPPTISERARDRRVLTSDNSTDSYTSSIATSNVSTHDEEVRSNQKVTQINTCKILQRKLELKVERAKRNYRQMYEEQEFNQDNQIHKTATLIPINRLAIPGGTVRDNQQPLVDVESTVPGSDEDELEAVTFFPRAAKKSIGSAQHKRQELSDTFSIQEMTIESDQEDELDYEQCRKLSNSKGYKKILNRGLKGDGDYLDNEIGDYEDEDDDDSQNLELLPPKTSYGLREWAQRAMCCFRRNELLS